MSGNVQVELEGKGLVTLRPSDHVATGGEGSIYRVGDVAVKIYSDRDKMRSSGMPDKLKLLSALQYRSIVAPAGLASTRSGDPVGYYMPIVPDPPASVALPLVFTNDLYRTRAMDARKAAHLVEGMRLTFSFAHSSGAILVDANELNWFAVFGDVNPEPRVVDVDSWAIGRWPATVIMPSIRDWHSKVFDEKSDWFAFGVVSFQVFCGIHPYRGSLDGFARADFLGRMKANASVFSPGVRLPAAVREFSSIPAKLLDWYEATFQNGERTPPPSALVGSATPRAIQTMRVVTTSATGSLVFERLLTVAGDPVVKVFSCGVAITASGALYEIATRRQIALKVPSDALVVRVSGGWMAAWIAGGRAVAGQYIPSVGGASPHLVLSFTLSASRLVSLGDRLFAVTGQGLTEIVAQMIGTRLYATPGNSWGIIENSMKWFDGFGVLDSMGARFLVAPFGDAAVAQLRVKELDGLKIVAGKSGARFISLVAADAKGDYLKIEITPDREYRTYEYWSGPIDGAEINLAILPRGVCASIAQDGELVIFVPTNGKVTKVQDKKIATTMALANIDDKVVYVERGEVWALRVK